MYGVIFECLDPILTVACALAYRDPWVLPVSTDGRRRASAIKRSFSEKGGGLVMAEWRARATPDPPFRRSLLWTSVMVLESLGIHGPMTNYHKSKAEPFP